MNNNTELDSFDRALLTELRQVAAERATAPVRRTRKRWAYAGTGVAAAAVAAFGLSSTLGSPSAYAVDEQGDGDIVITIHELDDADGLEQALAEHGIEADVDYRSDGIGGVVIDAPDHPDGAEIGVDGDGEVFKGEAEIEEGAEVDQAVPGAVPADGPCGGFDDMPFTAELFQDDYVITIPADSVLRETDAELLITTSGSVDDQVAGLEVSFSVDDVHCGFGTASLGTANDG